MESALRWKVLIIALGFTVVAATGVPVQAVGGPPEGCTPEFWKFNLAHWEPTKYSPTQTVSSVFPAAASYPTLGPATLYQALSFGGGPTVNGQSLPRIAVAALLNASHPGVNYPVALGQIIAGVNAALATGSLEGLVEQATYLDKRNNLGCPLGAAQFR